MENNNNHNNAARFPSQTTSPHSSSDVSPYSNGSSYLRRSTLRPSAPSLESSFSRLNISSSVNDPSPSFPDDAALFRLFSDHNHGRQGFFDNGGAAGLGFPDLLCYPMIPGLPARNPWGNYNTPFFEDPVPTRNWLPPPIDSREFSRRHSDHNFLNVPVPRNYNSNSLRGNFGGLYNGRPSWLQNPFTYLSLKDLRGRFLLLSKDQCGCKLLQKSLESVSVEEIKVVFSELIDHMGELMADPFGNYVVQKLVEVCSEEQRTQTVLALTKTDFELVSICLNAHGTRAVQHLLCFLNTRQQISKVISALSQGAVALTKDPNGNHTIQHCLRHFSFDYTKQLLGEVAENVFEIATDRSGCCVLQVCVDYAQGELKDRLVAEIAANAPIIAEDHYGNYVVQHLLSLGVPRFTARLLNQLQGSYMALSRNKYGSNVVEKCIELSTEEQSTRIILELISSPDGSMLLVDQYGNFVVQKALSVSKGEVHKALVKWTQMNTTMMRSNMYGKKVLAWFDKRRPRQM